MFPSQEIPMKAFRLGRQELLFQPQIKRIVASKRHDVVILTGNPRVLSNFPALWQASRKGVATVWWSLGIMANQSPVTIAIRRWLMRIPDAVVLYTKDERDYFVGRSVPPEKVFVAQNTIDVSAQREASVQWFSERLREFISEAGLAGKKILLFCARLKKIKRIDLLLRALSKVLTAHPDAYLVIIGGGPEEDALKSLSRDLQIEPHVRWLGPVYGPEQLAPWYLSSMALVIPSAIGLAMFQGFGFGLPCITTEDRKKQSPEATGLKDGYNCLLYKDEDVQDLATKMGLLIEDKELRGRLSANAKHTVDEDYTPEKMVNGFREAIAFAYNACQRRRLDQGTTVPSPELR